MTYCSSRALTQPQANWKLSFAILSPIRDGPRRLSTTAHNSLVSTTCFPRKLNRDTHATGGVLPTWLHGETLSEPKESSATNRAQGGGIKPETVISMVYNYSSQYLHHTIVSQIALAHPHSCIVWRCRPVHVLTLSRILDIVSESPQQAPIGHASQPRVVATAHRERRQLEL
jgi:hypothetical protein